MPDQHHLETTETERRVHPGRAHPRRANHGARHESRELIKLNASQREATQIRSMISDLECIVNTICRSIEAELEGARILNPSHFGFPMAARALVTRRDNLQATIAALAEHLTKIDQL